MRLRPSLILAVALALATAPLRTAHAQSTAPTATPTAPTPATPAPPALVGRIRFEEAVAALNEGRFADAATSFEASYRVNPVPVVLFNLAFAYRGLGRNLDAIDSIQRFLAAPGSTPEDRIAAGREELARLQTTIVRLTIRVTPAQAQVAIDGHPPHREGNFYLSDPGRHVITATLDGYRPQRSEQDFAPGSTHTIPWNLTAINDEGRLIVDSTITGAHIEVDGALATGTNYDQQVSAGTHQILVTADGYLPFRREVQVGGTGVVRVSAVLQRPRASALWWAVPLIIVVGGGALTAGGIGAEYLIRTPSTPTPPNCFNCFMKARP